MYISLRVFASIKQDGKIKSIRIPPIHTSKGGACAAVPPRNRSRESPPRLHRCAQRAAAALCNTPLCNGRTGSSSTRHLQRLSLRADAGMQSRSAGPSQCPSRIAGRSALRRPLLVREGRDHIPECILVLLVLLRVLHLRVGSQVLQIEGVGLAAKQPLKGLLCVTPHLQRHRIEQREVGGDQHVAHARLDPQRRLQDAVAQVELR